MFGESDSESPRVGSPWDSIMASSSPTFASYPASNAESEVKTRLGERLPKLVPEVEYVCVSSRALHLACVTRDLFHPLGQCRVQAQTPQPVARTLHAASHADEVAVAGGWRSGVL